MPFQNTIPQASPEDSQENSAYEPDFSLPKSLTQSLWRSLLGNLRDKFSPETLPPLILTSRPVDTGMLAGDVLSLPWYRTIFTNLGDVISPETLPPLQLESRPIELGELIGDQLNHMWWTSLLRNLADAAAPERQSPLQLTSMPADPGFTPGYLLLVHWSAVISGPKALFPAKPKLTYTGIGRTNVPEPKPQIDPGELEFIQGLEIDLKRDLRRSRFRQRIWFTLVTAQVALLVAGFFWK
ncbi:MAG: hypothetical protein ACHP8A_09720 [Terriglobales bacterium]|nr:hypothetical protein [Terriglobales bacterium]